MKRLFLIAILLFSMVRFSYAIKVRVVYKPDKSISVIYPVPGSRKPGETEAQWLQRVFDETMSGELSNLPYDDMDDSQLPATRIDRDAWEGEKGRPIELNSEKTKRTKDEKLLEKEVERQGKEENIKQKLNLTNEDFENLREALIL